jgi:uncharacterized membrane protein
MRSMAPAMANGEAAPLLYMDAVIQPNRSLSTRGMWIVLGVFAAFNLWMAVFLLMIGAYPVPIFLGFDLIGVIVAFRIYRRFAERVERVRVDAERIVVSREGAKGAATVWVSPTAFTRVKFETGREHARRLSLHLSGRSIAIGMALGADELERLHERLRGAMCDALAERHG